MDLRVVEHASAADVLDATQAYRSADPMGTNLVASIATGVVEGRRYDSELWLTVVDERGLVVGAACRTSPYSLVLGPMPGDAARAIGEHLLPRAAELPGVTGPDPAVTTLVDVLGRPYRVRMRDVLRVLGDLVPPAPTRGLRRRALPADGPLVLGWQRAYLAEVGLPVHVLDAESVRGWLVRLSLWEVDGEAVAMAGHAPLVETPGGLVGRIGPVYTVPEHRRLGFGAAVTAAVAQDLLDAGARVMLYADAANPGSNRVYERLGFAVAGEQLELDLL